MKTMYAITHISHGLRRLTFANQGRNHYERPEQAQSALNRYLAGLRSAGTEMEMRTLQVRPVECYEHGDAVGIYV